MQPKSLGLVLIVVLSAVFFLWTNVINKNDVGFDQLTFFFHPDAAQQKQIADFVRSGSQLPAALKEKSGRLMVFISASDGTKQARVFQGVGQSVAEALAKAVEAAKKSGGFATLWLKIDFVDSISDLDLNNSQANFSPGIDGVALTYSAVLLPSELVAYDLLENSRPAISRITAHLQMKPEEVHETYRFTTFSFFSDESGIYELYRGHRIFSDYNENILQNASRLALEYFKSIVGQDGRMAYTYDPAADKVGSTYNILRHTGSIFALIWAYEEFKDDSLLPAIDQAVAYLLKQIVPCQREAQAAQCVPDRGYVKLGANGLALLALGKYFKLTGKKELLPTLRGLGQWLLAVQEKNGDFLHKVSLVNGEAHSFRSEYYPGEAILGLLHLYEVDPQKKWLTAAELGANYLINIRDKDLPDKALTEDHWLLYSLVKLYQIKPDIHFKTHAFRIAHTMILRQILDPKLPKDWLGSFRQPPSGTNTSTNSEGLCQALKLAIQEGEKEIESQIRETLRKAIAQQLQTQFWPESVMYFAHPEKALGGFRHSPETNSIRIDYMQHHLSSFLCLLKTPREGG